MHLQAVLLLDVDMGVSRSLLSILSNAQQYKQLKAMLQDNNAVVLPAFELKHGGADEWQLWQHLLAGGKELVTRQYRCAVLQGGWYYFYDNKQYRCGASPSPTPGQPCVAPVNVVSVR